MKNEVNSIVEEIYNCLKCNGLSKLPPFLCIPKLNYGDNYLSITYSASEILREKNVFREGFRYGKDINLSKIVENEKSYWSVIVSDGIAIKFDVAQNSNGKPPEYYHVDDVKIPIYIKVFYNLVKSRWRKSLISFTDSLPFNFIVSIKPVFNLKKERQDVLKQLVDATILYYNEDVYYKIDEIINDSKIQFKMAVDEIAKLANNNPEVNYSFCLACGQMVEKNRDVCPRHNTSISNEPWKCRNNINNRIKSNFEVKGDKVKEKRQELYLELKSILKKYPLFGYDKFKEIHSADIFKDKRKK